MKTPRELRTDRLWLRRWRESDREPLALLNADDAVMEFFSAPLTPAESDEMVDRIEPSSEERGFGLWAVEVRATGSFAGFAGLWPARFEAHSHPPSRSDGGSAASTGAGATPPKRPERR